MTTRTRSLAGFFRTDLTGRFNELDVLRRQWALFAANTAGNVLPPYEVLIHPSSGCNLRCQWCIGDHVPVELWDDDRETLVMLDASKQAPDRLPDVLADPAAMMKLARELVDYRKTATYESDGSEHTAEFRVSNVSFSGLIGEPLVSRRALMPAIEHLVDNGMRVGMFTNGVLMDDRVVEVLGRTAYVHLSLDAGTADTYGALKFKGHKSGAMKFEKAVENLRKLVAHRRENGGELEINVSFILYPENYHEVRIAAELVKGIGADRLRLKRDISGDRLLDQHQRDHANRLIAGIRDDLVDDTFQLVEVHKLDQLGESKRQFSTCSITDMMAAIGSDGHLYPCNYHPRPGGASYGSAVETSFQEVWEGPVRMATRRHLPSICPSVCDPFKNRANTMLQEAKEIVAEEGLDYLERDVHQLVANHAYDTAHGHAGDR